MKVRLAKPEDRDEWVRLRGRLWPDAEPGEHAREVDEMIGSSTAAVFVAEREGGGLAGFLELELRSYADGCESRPVPYVEGWYVDSDRRRRGVGRLLMDAAAAWARERGYIELGSDCELGNRVSEAAHRAIGFDEVGRVVQFRRPL